MQTKKIVPPALHGAAAKVATAATKAAAAQTGLTPHALPGSPADAAALTVALGEAAKVTRMSAELAGKGPQRQATTAAGVATLQGQDAQNAAEIAQVGADAQTHALYT